MNLYQDLFFRTLDLLRGRRTIQRLNFLRQSQYWDRDTLKRWQLNRLNDLLFDAKANSPFHKERLAHIQLPLTSLDEIESLPVLTKDEIRENGENIKNRSLPADRFVPSRTGGSTGEPMQYFWDKRGMDWNRGCVYRSAEWAGTKLGERTVQMSGSHYDYNEMQKLKWKLVFFLQRYRDMPIAYMNSDLLENYYQELVRYRPTSIWGYASGVSGFAEHIAKHHPDAVFPWLKGIVTSSENLLPKQRELINRVFGKNKVFDNYGSREMYMAAECSEHDGYHIHAEVILLEVVDRNNRKAKPGEMGRILLTDLSNHAFPFIRYEVGDIGTMSESTDCNCGIRLPKLKTVEGRIADLVVLPDRVLTAPNFATLFSDLSGIQSYQIRQDKENEVDVLIVPATDYSDQVRRYIATSMQDLVGTKVKVRVNEVNQIEVPESGKRRFVVSSVSKHAV
ncbi:MAG: phenylacetate--CoA ligase family protein [Acidiferrobacterales bacterium]